jgi:hypothetical protein
VTPSSERPPLEQRVADLLARMTLAEKIGQMSQVDVTDVRSAPRLHQALREGGVQERLQPRPPCA